MSDTQYEADTFPAAQVFALWQLWPFSENVYDINTRAPTTKAHKGSHSRLRCEKRVKFLLLSITYAISTTQTRGTKLKVRRKSELKNALWDETLWQDYGPKQKQQVEKSEACSRSKKRNLLKPKFRLFNKKRHTDPMNFRPPRWMEFCVYFGERWYCKHTKKTSAVSFLASRENQSLCSICCLFASLFAVHRLPKGDCAGNLRSTNARQET